MVSTTTEPSPENGNSKVFSTAEIENNLYQLEKNFGRLDQKKKTTNTSRVKRVKKHYKQKQRIEDRDWNDLLNWIDQNNFEAPGLVLESDFEGVFEKDMNSALRKRVQRVKTSSTDTVVMGRILTKNGNHKVPFVCDTGCSVNILPARFASICGLKWQEPDLNEATYTLATNHEL